MIDILWSNNFSDNGYGRCGRRYVQILKELGYNVKIDVQSAQMSVNDPLILGYLLKIADGAGTVRTKGVTPWNRPCNGIIHRKDTDIIIDELPDRGRDGPHS